MSNLKKTTSSYSFRDRIDYILNVCLYCWYRWISKVEAAIDKYVSMIIRAIVSSILPKRLVYKVYRNRINGKKDLYIMNRDIEYGHNIRVAKDMVNFTCMGYVALPVAVVTCITCTLIGWDNVFMGINGKAVMVVIAVVLLMEFIGVSKLAKAIEDSSIYLSYFKKFQKQDEEWLRKWKIYTILIFSGAMLSPVLILLFGFLCIDIGRNINYPLI